MDKNAQNSSLATTRNHFLRPPYSVAGQEIEETFFYKSDAQNFLKWLNLNWNSVTWEGKRADLFRRFWDRFFVDGLSIAQLMGRYQYASKKIRPGPLHSWFQWLRNKNLIYLLIFKGVSFSGLGGQTNIDAATLSTILHDFFCDKFPEDEQRFHHYFHLVPHGRLGAMGAQSEHPLNFNMIELNLLDEKGRTSLKKSGGHDEEIMASLEVTLFEDWSRFLKKIERDFHPSHKDVDQLLDNLSILTPVKFVAELALLLILGTGLIFGLKTANNWYEENLARKIQSLNPDFLINSAGLSFRSIQQREKSQNHKILKHLEQEQKNIQLEVPAIEERFETESDIVLASGEGLQQDLQGAQFETSHYEEQKAGRGGYRDQIYGRNKVYRVMLKSIQSEQTKHSIDQLISSYQAIPVSRVLPGTSVPGGIYYNLLLPVKQLRRFLSEVDKLASAQLYVSRTRRGPPPGKAKVFIWIKRI